MLRRLALPLGIVLLWLLVGGPLGSFAGQLGSVQENDNAAFLPQSSESTRALDAFVEFAGDESLPLTVVVERDGGLTGEDRRGVEALGEAIAEVDGVRAGRGGLQVSEDGEAGQLVLEVTTSDGEEVAAAVEEVRGLTADFETDGLTVLVGGQAGIQADFVEAFGAIDGLLLLVALAVVLVILLVVYRSPALPLIVLVSAVLGLGVSSAAVYGLTVAGLLDLNGQSQAILFILAIGAATDYSLLLVARFREELKDHEDPLTAMRKAWRATLEPVLASGLTVILGLLCLLLSDLSSLRGLGPVGAIGIVGAMLSSMTLLPAALVLLGRRWFWPAVPRYGDEHRDDSGLWGRVAGLVRTGAGRVAAGTTVVLAVLAAFTFTLEEDPVPQTELFLTDVDSATAQEILDEHFAADASSPAQVIVPADRLQAVAEAAAATPGVAAPAGEGVPPVVPLPSPEDPQQPLVVDARAVLFVTLADPADSAAAQDTVRELRERTQEVDDEVLVGGSTAILVDVRDATLRDRAVVIPAILLVILVVLGLLLRSVLAAVLLVVANVLSFGATMGVAALVFDQVLGFPATDPSTPLIAFVFLVALGIDYSIFLMTRVREESLARGTLPGVLKGLRVTGGVITSAGVVLAATFAALSVVPILFIVEIAFIVSFGVLLDTLVVRSLLVPSLVRLLGGRTWWPNRLAADAREPAGV